MTLFSIREQSEASDKPMNKKLIVVFVASSMLLSGCGLIDETMELLFDSSSSSVQEQTEFSEYEPESYDETDSEVSKVSEDKTESDDYFSSESGKIVDDIDYLKEPDEDELMEIDMNRHSMKADDDGFVIKDNILYDYKGVRSEVHIPDGVKRIESHAFWSIDFIKAVYIPSSVEAIGEGAFWSCGGLEYVKMDEGVKQIGSTAFWSCSSLSDVEIPESIESIPMDVFWAVSDITIHGKKGSYAEDFASERGFEFTDESFEFVIDRDAKVISAGMYRNKDFEEFIISDDVTGIEAEAFQYCKKLKYIDVPANVDFIGANAFEYCYGLEKAQLSCREIKAEAFEYCKALSEVIIMDGCEKIGSSAFAYCEVLTDVYIPESVQNIDQRAFEYNSSDLVFHVAAGSYAEDFARAMKIPFDHNT